MVGRSQTVAGYEAFRWDAASGMVGLGHLPGGGVDSIAFDASDDGSVVVGYSDSASGANAFRWTADEGMVNLGALPGRGSSEAFGVSADGNVIVGTSGYEAFYWTPDEGMTGLGDVPNGENSTAYAVSADGSVIVGHGYSYGHRAFEPFRWTRETGMQYIRDLLNESGINEVEDWDLRFATGISADGTTIVGNGQNPDNDLEAWVVTLPVPEPAKGQWLLAFAFALVLRSQCSSVSSEAK